jgi:glycolate oxidase FAD binding subunit
MINDTSLLPEEKTSTPADTAAVAEAVREAAKEGRAIYPRGSLAGSHDTGLILSLEKMNRLIDHAAEDMTVTVEAGMTFAELAKILAAKNQRLPIDVPNVERATLGGLVAVNAAGPRQFGYGTMRDYFLGFTAVDGEGTIFQGGGRVVKNAAGYNMTRLMAGSRGTLCILTQLTLMVRPLPEMTAVASCDLPDLETAEKLLADLNKSQVRPVAVELNVGWVKQSADPPMERQDGGTALCLSHPTSIDVVLEGPAAEVQWMLETLKGEWESSGVLLQSSTEQAANAKVQQLAVFSADARIAVWPSQVVELVGTLREKFPGCSIRSHALSGIVMIEGGREKSEGGDFFRQLRSTVESFGGRMTVLKTLASGELSLDDIWGSPPGGIAVMRSIKDRFDPKNILNPGKFIFE